jgi:hypothetical protein
MSIGTEGKFFEIGNASNDWQQGSQFVHQPFNLSRSHCQLKMDNYSQLIVHHVVRRE